MNAKKARTSAIAVVAALAIALSGTFAWQSISQTALNEAKGANPGGRLHDDFSGYTATDTKDIYVENFASQAIYARIRLDEYMEIGTGAGEADGTEGKTATSLVSGAVIGDPTTWTTHIPSTDDVAVGTEDGGFHDYWTWTMGGQTVYMPTFNKNQDSLAADINGTLEGTTAGDDLYYDDYYKYTLGETKTDDAYYDIDDDTVDEDSTKPGNGGTEGTDYKIVNETHTAAETINGTVITMAEYQALSDTDPGDGSDWKGNVQAWVYDTDGWAYWSQAIQPGTATGLLLDNITLSNTPTDEWYYAINAVAQFITADDLGLKDGTGFYTEADEAPSADALTLLATIGVKTDVAAVITDENDNVITGQTFSLTAGATKTLSVTNIATTAESYAEQTWNWTTSNSSVVSLSATTGDSVTATVATDATADSTATITVTNQDDADQTATVTIKVVATEGETGGEENETPTYTVSITDSSSSAVTGSVSMTVGDAAQTYTASVTVSDSSTPSGSWTWTSSAESVATVSGSGATGTVSAVAAGDTTITVKYMDGTTELASASFTVTVSAAAKTYSVGETVTLDNIEFVVMATNVNGNSDHILLLSKYILEEQGFDEQNHSSIGAGGSDTYGDNIWSESRLRTYLNSTDASGVTVVKDTNGSTTTVAGWLNGKTDIQKAAVETTIYTTTDWNDATLRSTTDKIFLLSQADVFGTYSLNNTDTAVTDTKMYTIGEKLDLTNNSTVTSWVANHTETDGGAADWWWLRSPRSTTSYNFNVAYVYTGGALGSNLGYVATGGVRPAFVASIQNLPSE